MGDFDIVDEYGRPFDLMARRQREEKPQRKPTFINRISDMIFKGSPEKQAIKREAQAIYAQEKAKQMHLAAKRMAQAKLAGERNRPAFGGLFGSGNRQNMVGQRSGLFGRSNVMRMETRPSRLFRDTDRDGVADVFDCRPRDRRYQDSDTSGKMPTKEEIDAILNRAKAEYVPKKPRKKSIVQEAAQAQPMPAAAPMPAPISQNTRPRPSYSTPEEEIRAYAQLAAAKRAAQAATAQAQAANQPTQPIIPLADQSISHSITIDKFREQMVGKKAKAEPSKATLFSSGKATSPRWSKAETEQINATLKQIYGGAPRGRPKNITAEEWREVVKEMARGIPSKKAATIFLTDEEGYLEPMDVSEGRNYNVASLLRGVKKKEIGSMPGEFQYDPRLLAAIQKATAEAERPLTKKELAQRKSEKKILAETAAAVEAMKYVPSAAQPRIKKIMEQMEDTRRAGLFGAYTGRYKTVKQPLMKGGKVVLVGGMPVYVTKKIPEYKKGALTKAVETGEYYAGRIAAMPKRFVGGLQGARRIERGTKKAPGIGQYATLATSVGGFLFPGSSLPTLAKQKGMYRGRVGRPAGVYKYISPLTGRPVHVFEYRKHMEVVRRRAKMLDATREENMAKQMMRRGLPPDLAYAQAEQYQQLVMAQKAQRAPTIAAETFAESMPQSVQRMQPQPSMQAVAPSYSQSQTAPMPQRAPINMLGAGPSMANPFARQQQSSAQYAAPPGSKPKYNIFTGQTTYEPQTQGQESWVNSRSSWAQTPEGSIFRRPVQIGVRKQNQYYPQEMQGGEY